MAKRIRISIIFPGLCLLMVLLGGCALLYSSSRNENAGVLPVYSGPKAKVQVADFVVVATKASTEIGAGLKEMFLSALSSGNHFKIIEPEGNAKANLSDLIITVSVSDFEPQASGGSSGTGGGGGVNSGVLGGLLGATVNKAHIALDIKITDAATSQIVAQGVVQGQATDVSGALMSDSSVKWSLGSNLFAYANTPMEKAIRICTFEAVRYITGSIPERYYKY